MRSLAADRGIVETRPEEHPRVIEFLSSVFGVPASEPFLDAALARWRFFAPHPYWKGGRSFTMRRDGEIAAHSCVWPIQLRVGGRCFDSMHLIDWASSKAFAGAGMILNLELMKQADTAIGIGGSPMARKVAARMGFVPRGRMLLYARVVRPWRQSKVRPAAAGWKAPLRFARNSIWSLAPTAHGEKTWSAEPTAEFPQALDALLAERSMPPYILPVRSSALLNHILEVPGLIPRGLLMRNRGVVLGYALLTRAGGQTRICDLWIDSRDESDWTAAYSLAVRAAAEDPETCEIASYGSLPVVETALRRNRFRRRGEKPIIVRDPGKVLGATPLPAFGALESDAFYLYDPSSPFLT